MRSTCPFVQGCAIFVSRCPIIFAANTVEDVFKCRGILLAVGEPDAVIRQDRVDAAGQSGDEIAQELCRNHFARSLMQSDKNKPGSSVPSRAMDGNEKAWLSLAGSYLCDVNVNISNRVFPELLLRGFVARHIRQAANAVALQTPVQR